MSVLNIVYQSSVETTDEIQAAHFSGNIISTVNTASGVPTSDFHEAVENLGIETLRYPAGQPDTVYADGMLEEGALQGGIISFLEWARDGGFKVLLVTPTFESYPGAEVISEFVRLALSEYGDVVSGFEIGNEYWQSQSEAEYGEIANETIIAIENGASGLDYVPEVLIQMANPSGSSTSYPAGTDSWGNRVTLANQEIIEQLSDAAREAIDVVVEHYYFNDEPASFSGEAHEMNFIPDKLDVWEDEFGRSLDLHITEWNVTSRNLDALGMRAASTLLQQFEYMITMGVDAAYVWPPHHNTSNDLAGSGEVIVDPLSGIVVNSIGGAVFDLMSSSLRGTHVVEMNVEGLDGALNLNAYSSDQKTVLYVSSMAETVSDISFDIGGYIDSFVAVDGVLVGYDAETSNGRHYNYQLNQFVDSEFVMVEGDKYFLNEHDVQAEISLFDESDLGGGTSLSFQLKPFEIMQITYHHEIPRDGTTDDPPSDGTEEGMSIVGSSDNDSITGGIGNDSIDAGAGDDLIIGGLGDDQIIGNRGNDTIEADAGADTVNGWGGDDEIYGGSGSDRLYGQQGSDTIIGGQGADTIFGGDDDDLLIGNEGHNKLHGDAGNDTLNGGNHRDVMTGGSGNDELNLSGGNDLAYGQEGHDTLNGGFGADELNGMDGNDVLTGGSLSDLLTGGRGNDFINGGYGYDRINGGEGADKFFHLGIEGHGSDWIQDYSAADGDVLLFGYASATADDFQINVSNTEGAGASDVDEAYVIYKPTGQIIWALVDGADQDEIVLKLGGDFFDLVA